MSEDFFASLRLCVSIRDVFQRKDAKTQRRRQQGVWLCQDFWSRRRDSHRTCPCRIKRPGLLAIKSDELPQDASVVVRQITALRLLVHEPVWCRADSDWQTARIDFASECRTDEWKRFVGIYE